MRERALDTFSDATARLATVELSRFWSAPRLPRPAEIVSRTESATRSAVLDVDTDVTLRLL